MNLSLIVEHFAFHFIVSSHSNLFIAELCNPAVRININNISSRDQDFKILVSCIVSVFIRNCCIRFFFIIVNGCQRFIAINTSQMIFVSTEKPASVFLPVAKLLISGNSPAKRSKRRKRAGTIIVHIDNVRFLRVQAIYKCNRIGGGLRSPLCMCPAIYTISTWCRQGVKAVRFRILIICVPAAKSIAILGCSRYRFEFASLLRRNLFNRRTAMNIKIHIILCRRFIRQRERYQADDHDQAQEQGQ